MEELQAYYHIDPKKYEGYSEEFCFYKVTEEKKDIILSWMKDQNAGKIGIYKISDFFWYVIVQFKECEKEYTTLFALTFK